jgi:hypothetical protein
MPHSQLLQRISMYAETSRSQGNGIKGQLWDMVAGCITSYGCIQVDPYLPHECLPVAVVESIRMCFDLRGSRGRLATVFEKKD